MRTSIGTGLLAGFASLLCAAALSASIAATPAEDEFPAKARLTKGKVLDVPLRAYALPRGVKASETQGVLGATIGKQKVVFVDVDGNGRYGDVGVDGWTLDARGYNYIVPIEEWIVIDGRLAWLRFDDDRKLVRFRLEAPLWPQRVPRLTGKDAAFEFKQSKREVWNGFRLWNKLRMQNGLPPVFLDEELTYGAIMHARYMDAWGLGHDEIEANDGYTPEGARAGKTGSVGSLPASQEIGAVYRTLYHRLMLFHPATRGAGVGDARKRSVFNAIEDRRDRPWQWPIMIPAPECEDVPLRFELELPIPHDDVFDGTAPNERGFPITITFERPDIKDVEAQLRVGGPDGPPWAFELSWPEKPASPEKPTNFKSICVFPHRAFSPRTKYWVRVKWTYRRKTDERSWTFTTGK